MPRPTADAVVSAGRRQRLSILLERLAAEGSGQQRVAMVADLSPQYLSDMKTGRRPLTELAARRLTDVFGANRLWLLEGRGSMKGPIVRPGGKGLSFAIARLPMLSEPIVGEPTESPKWDGTYFEVGGSAALGGSYVLRLTHGDADGRLRLNDILLVDGTTATPAPTPMMVVTHEGKAMLARQGPSKWRSVQSGRALDGAVVPIAQVLAIIWGSAC